VGSFPIGVAANPRTNAIYVGNSGSQSVSVISGRTNTVVATIPVGIAPQAVAADARLPPRLIIVRLEPVDLRHAIPV